MPKEIWPTIGSHPARDLWDAWAWAWAWALLSVSYPHTEQGKLPSGLESVHSISLEVSPWRQTSLLSAWRWYQSGPRKCRGHERAFGRVCGWVSEEQAVPQSWFLWWNIQRKYSEICHQLIHSTQWAYSLPSGCISLCVRVSKRMLWTYE